jgi:hypothetical protein
VVKRQTGIGGIIGSNIPKPNVKEVSLSRVDFDASTLKPGILSRARYINKVFAVTKGQYTGTKRRPFREDSKEFRSFIKLAANLPPSFDLTNWIKAHFESYDGKVHPSQLFASNSMTIFYLWSVANLSPILCMDDTERVTYRDDLVKHLCARWHMTEHDVRIKFAAVLDQVV